MQTADAIEGAPDKMWRQFPQTGRREAPPAGASEHSGIDVGCND
jgi:hypothetical protein